MTDIALPILPDSNAAPVIPSVCDTRTAGETCSSMLAECSLVRMPEYCYSSSRW